jgi:hypothetical protein
MTNVPGAFPRRRMGRPANRHCVPQIIFVPGLGLALV